MTDYAEITMALEDISGVAKKAAAAIKELEAERDASDKQHLLDASRMKEWRDRAEKAEEENNRLNRQIDSRTMAVKDQMVRAERAEAARRHGPMEERMTEAQRALLLDLASRTNACRDWSDRPHLLKLIAAVEAEAAPKDDIGFDFYEDDTALAELVSDTCASCGGHGRYILFGDVMPCDCIKKETK